MGVKAGVPDMMFWHRGQNFQLEIKTEKGRASEAQLEWRDRMLNQGVKAMIGYGYEQIYNILKFTWGLIK